MLEELAELGEGGIFAKVGIKNFLEADYFACGFRRVGCETS